MWCNILFVVPSSVFKHLGGSNSPSPVPVPRSHALSSSQMPDSRGIGTPTITPTSERWVLVLCETIVSFCFVFLLIVIWCVCVFVCFCQGAFTRGKLYVARSVNITLDCVLLYVMICAHWSMRIWLSLNFILFYLTLFPLTKQIHQKFIASHCRIYIYSCLFYLWSRWKPIFCSVIFSQSFLFHCNWMF